MGTRMWIICNNSATSRLYNADLMDEPVDFNENGTANVPESVGESLVENYDQIETYNKED